MAKARPDDRQIPAKVTDATFEPVSEADPDWGSDERGHRARAPLSFSGRMFNVGWKGWTRLVIVCVIIGAVFQAGGFNPFAPGFTIGGGLGQIVNGVINIAGWAAQNGGLPLLLGAPAMAFTFSILNAALLWWRIRIENDVLTERVGTT